MMLDVSDTSATQPFCASGWPACTGADLNLGRNDVAHHSALIVEDARSFSGCYVYNANNDCNQCQDTCGEREGSGSGSQLAGCWCYRRGTGPWLLGGGLWAVCWYQRKRWLSGTGSCTMKSSFSALSTSMDSLTSVLVSA